MGARIPLRAEDDSSGIRERPRADPRRESARPGSPPSSTISAAARRNTYRPYSAAIGSCGSRRPCPRGRRAGCRAPGAGRRRPRSTRELLLGSASRRRPCRPGSVERLEAVVHQLVAISSRYSARPPSVVGGVGRREQPPAIGSRPGRAPGQLVGEIGQQLPVVGVEAHAVAGRPGARRIGEPSSPAAWSPTGRARGGGTRRARPAPGCPTRPRPGPCGGCRASARWPSPSSSRTASGTRRSRTT